MNQSKDAFVFEESEPQMETFPKEVSLQEYLKQENDDLSVFNLLKQMVRVNPFLANVKIVFISHDTEPNTGGTFDIVKVDEHALAPIISIVENNKEHMERVLRERRSSIELVARKLGIPFEKMTPELLRIFIISHELGHASDYIKNYQLNPNYGSVEGAVEDWNVHYEATISSLPVSDLDPSQLKDRLNKYSSIKEFIADFPETRIDTQKITSLGQLLHEQEVAYRNSPYEKYADDFAANFLKNNARQIGLLELAA